MWGPDFTCQRESDLVVSKAKTGSTGPKSGQLVELERAGGVVPRSTSPFHDGAAVNWSRQEVEGSVATVAR